MNHKRVPSRVQDCSNLLEENFPLRSEERSYHSEPTVNSHLHARRIPPSQRKSRLPGRGKPIRRSRLPGKHTVPHPRGRHSRSISREEVYFRRSGSREEDDGYSKREPKPISRFRVDMIPIAGFAPASRSASEQSSVATPTQSMMAMNGDNHYAYRHEVSMSHSRDHSDSYMSLPEIPAAASSPYVPKLRTILSPSAIDRSVQSQFSDHVVDPFFEVRNKEQMMSTDQLSEVEVWGVLEPEMAPQSNIKLLKVSEYRPHHITGHLELETIRETTVSYQYEPTCSTVSGELPPLPIETDEEDCLGIETESNPRVADFFDSTRVADGYQSDIASLPDLPPVSSSKVSSSPNPPPLPSSASIDPPSPISRAPEIKRRPQLSLLRAHVDPPLIEKRMPHTPEPLLANARIFFPPNARSSAEPGSLPRRPNASDLNREDSAMDTPEPDLIISHIPDSWSKEVSQFRNEGVVEGVTHEGYPVAIDIPDQKASNSHRLSDCSDRRHSGGLSPRGGISPHSQSSRRTSSAAGESTSEPDIVVGNPYRPSEYRGTLHMHLEGAWRPLFAILCDGVLELRIVEQGLRLFGSVPLHLVSSMKVEPGRDPIYPFNICLNPRYSAGFIHDNLHIESPRGETSMMTHKQQTLRFSAGSSALREGWTAELSKYIAVQAQAEEEALEGILQLWPPEMIQTMEACFSQFENSVTVDDFVRICEVCELPVGGKDLFEALDVRDKGFVLWRKVRKTLLGISDTARLGPKDELDLFISKSKQQKLYKKHKKKALVLRGLNPAIRDSEDWLSKIEDVFGDFGADYFPLSKSVVGESVEFVFKECLVGDTFFRDITDRIKRVLIDYEDQNPRSISVEYLSLSEFVENYRLNKQYFEEGIGSYFE